MKATTSPFGPRSVSRVQTLPLVSASRKSGAFNPNWTIGGDAALMRRSSSCNAAMSAGDRSATAPPTAAAPPTAKPRAPISPASHWARPTGSLASGTGRPSAAIAMCVGAQTAIRPPFSAQSSSVRESGDREPRVGVGDRPGRLLEREQPDPALRLGRRRRLRRAPTQSTSGPPSAASASRHAGAPAASGPR